MTGNSPGPHDHPVPGFVAPAEVAVPFGHRLRPVRAGDLALHRVAVPGTGEDDLRLMVAEAERGRAWSYVLLDADETAILGGVRVEQGVAGTGHGWWWLVSECVGTDLAAAFDELVSGWLVDRWPFFGAGRPSRDGTPAGTRLG